MKVVGRKCLEGFKTRHADVRSQADAWLSEAMSAKWEKPQDIKEKYADVSFLSNDRVIFNLKGNSYRLLVKISYKSQIVRVLKVGTHAQYSKWKL